jgi:hypothetical protein
MRPQRIGRKVARANPPGGLYLLTRRRMFSRETDALPRNRFAPQIRRGSHQLDGRAEARHHSRRHSGWSTLAATAAFLALLASADAALAAPPPNDAFAAAQVLTGKRGGVFGTNVGATKELGEPNHAGNQGGASVWYRWTAPRDGQFAFSTRNTDFDTVLGIYTGSDVAALTVVAADDDSGPDGVRSELSFRAAGGTTYHIAIDGFLGKVGRIVLSCVQLL